MREDELFIDGKSTIFIFKTKISELKYGNFYPDYDNLLIPPQIVDISYWKQGYFYNVNNVPLMKKERNLNYGFFDITFGKYKKEDGTVLERQPDIFGVYGVSTIISIAYKIEKEIIINPDNLEFEC